MTTDALTPATSRATLAIGAEQIARRVADLLTETLEDGEAAVAAFARSEGRWDVAMHFAAPPDQERIRALAALAAGDDIAQTIVFDAIAAKDWVRASLDGLSPVAAGRFIVHGQHDRAHVPLNKLGIEIEAALAFGTGHHGTTRGCLLLLDQVLRSKMPRRVLDLGSGTGVLAIAAAKALRRKVLASDIDPRAAIVARENAALNGAGNLVESICATGFSAPQFRARAPFDLVLANILANPLRQMAPAMAAHLAPEAMVILSGLLPHQTRSVIAAYRTQGLVFIRQIRIDGWCSLLMQNRG
jgi:ribosomal protein L11 methyltransferase